MVMKSGDGEAELSFVKYLADAFQAKKLFQRYYDLDAYHRRMMEKQMKKGWKKAPAVERTVFNDEEQRRQELLIERERQKEEQVEMMKHSMQSVIAG